MSPPFVSWLGRATAPAQTKIYVGNVEPHITTEMIKTVFEPFGMVVGAEMVVDPNNPGNVSYGYWVREVLLPPVVRTMPCHAMRGKGRELVCVCFRAVPCQSLACLLTGWG